MSDKTNKQSASSKSGKEQIKKEMPELNTEDRLETNSLGLIPKIKYKYNRCLKNMEGMNKWEKFKYFIYFYRGTMIITALVLFLLISIPIYIYKLNRPVAISYAIVNQFSLSTPSEDSIDGFREYFNYGNDYQVRAYTGIQLEPTESLTNSGTDAKPSMGYNADSEAGYIQFPILCRDGYIDFVLMDSTGLKCCHKSDLFLSLEEAMSSDTYDKLLERYPDLRIVKIIDADDNTINCAIDISHTDFAKGFSLSYDEVYIAFPETQDTTNQKPKELIEYIFGIKTTN